MFPVWMVRWTAVLVPDTEVVAGLDLAAGDEETETTADQ